MPHKAQKPVLRPCFPFSTLVFEISWHDESRWEPTAAILAINSAQKDDSILKRRLRVGPSVREEQSGLVSEQSNGWARRMLSDHRRITGLIVITRQLCLAEGENNESISSYFCSVTWLTSKLLQVTHNATNTLSREWLLRLSLSFSRTIVIIWFGTTRQKKAISLSRAGRWARKHSA